MCDYFMNTILNELLLTENSCYSLRSWWGDRNAQDLFNRKDMRNVKILDISLCWI